jgi:hypothetical protein
MTKYMITWNHKSEPTVELCQLCKECSDKGCGYKFEELQGVWDREIKNRRPIPRQFMERKGGD